MSQDLNNVLPLLNKNRLRKKQAVASAQVFSSLLEFNNIDLRFNLTVPETFSLVRPAHLAEMLIDRFRETLPKILELNVELLASFVEYCKNYPSPFDSLPNMLINFKDIPNEGTWQLKIEENKLTLIRLLPAPVSTVPIKITIS